MVISLGVGICELVSIEWLVIDVVSRHSDFLSLFTVSA